MASNYEIGLAEGRAEGAVAVAVLCKRMDEIKADRDEWKQQHENLLAMYRTQTEELGKLKQPRMETRPALLEELPDLLDSHGHVRPRPDGVKMRCGGPAMCKVCAAEKAALNRSPE